MVSVGAVGERVEVRGVPVAWVDVGVALFARLVRVAVAVFLGVGV